MNVEYYRELLLYAESPVAILKRVRKEQERDFGHPYEGRQGLFQRLRRK